MDENKLMTLWMTARMHVIVSQFAPTFLLITTVGLVPNIRVAGSWAVWATLGILLASGILGALVQFTAANEAQAIARDLGHLSNRSHSANTAIAQARWLAVVKFVTPTIFVGIFIALGVSLLVG